MNQEHRTSPRSIASPINAWGTPTPYGVSRSPQAVVDAVSQGLRQHVDMQQLQELTEELVCDLSGAQAACFCHCAAGGLVIAAAAAITGTEKSRVAGLPTANAEAVVLLQTEHAIDYGQPITQTLSLCGAGVVVLHGTAQERTRQAEHLASSGRLKAIVFVESQLVKADAALGRQDCQSLAERLGALFIVDAAAQDWRMGDRAFIAEADLTVFSGQKYLAAPTCGVIVGRTSAIDACKANLTGIGRPMKPTKESLFGLAAALNARDWSAIDKMRDTNVARAHAFAAALPRTAVWRSQIYANPIQGPYPRIAIQLESAQAASSVIAWLRSLNPPIVIGASEAAQGRLVVELTYVDAQEESYLLEQLATAARVGVGREVPISTTLS